MHLVSQRRSTRIQFSQIVLKPLNLCFPFYKILLPLLCTTEQSKQRCRSCGPEKAPQSRLLWQTQTVTAPGSSTIRVHQHLKLPQCIITIPHYNPYQNIYLYIRPGRQPQTMVVLFCLGKITLHGILTILICSVPPALHFMCSGSPDHCQDEGDKGLRADDTTEQAVQVFFSQLGKLRGAGEQSQGNFPALNPHQAPHTPVSAGHSNSICSYVWLFEPSTLKFTPAPTVHHHLPRRVLVSSQRDAQSPALPNNMTWQTASPLSRIPSTTVILSGTACSSSAPTTDPVPQGKEPGTAPEVSPQTSPVTASPVRPSTPATAISSTWCCTLTADPTAGSSCAVPCWSARQPRAASSFPPGTSRGSEQSGWAGVSKSKNIGKKLNFFETSLWEKARRSC